MIPNRPKGSPIRPESGALEPFVHPIFKELTRAAVAREVGCSIATVRRAETTGELSFRLDEQGVHKFKADDVTRWGASFEGPKRKRVDAGELAARAFEAFAKGATAQGLVVSLRVPPETAARLYAEWSASAPIALSAEQVRELETLGVEPSAAGIIAAVRRLRERLRELRRAPDRPTTLPSGSPG